MEKAQNKQELRDVYDSHYMRLMGVNTLEGMIAELEDRVVDDCIEKIGIANFWESLQDTNTKEAAAMLYEVRYLLIRYRTEHKKNIPPVPDTWLGIMDWITDVKKVLQADAQKPAETEHENKKSRIKRGRRKDPKIKTRNRQIGEFKANNPDKTYKEIGRQFMVSAEVVRKACNNPDN